jgi:hypothetical protein
MDLGSWGFSIGFIVFILLFGLFLFNFAKGGGPAKEGDQPEWAWTVTPVQSDDCLADLRGTLVRQTKLPDPTTTLASGMGTFPNVASVAVMGSAAGKTYDLDKDGNETNVENYAKIKGTTKDCCQFLRQSGQLGPGIFDPAKGLCYQLPTDYTIKSPTKPGDPVSVQGNEATNAFDLHSPAAHYLASDIADDITHPVALIPCGGQGAPPCVKKVITATSQSSKENIEGCNNTVQWGTKEDQTVKLVHKYVNSPLPYGTKGYTVCQTIPHLNAFGPSPKKDSVKFDVKKEWNAPWNPNDSTASLMMPENVP